MIRGEGTALAFEEAGEVESSAIISFQGRISAAADTSVSLSVDAALLEFQDTLDMGVGSSLVIEGAIDILDFRAGFSISTGATVVLRSSEPTASALHWELLFTPSIRSQTRAA